MGYRIEQKCSPGVVYISVNDKGEGIHKKEVYTHTIWRSLYGRDWRDGHTS